MKFTLDLHHVVLYALLAVVSLATIGVVHSWRMDIGIAKVKAAADEQAIATIEKDKAERAKQFVAQMQFFDSLRVKKPLPPRVLVQRLAQVEPSLAVVPGQLVAPLPDAPKANLALTPEQQVTLVNRLVDCKECEAERAKLKVDLAGQKSVTAEREAEVATWKTAAKGGSLKQRLKRRLWHFAEDAIIIEGLRIAGGRP